MQQMTCLLYTSTDKQARKLQVGGEVLAFVW